MVVDVIKIALPFVISFLIGLIFTPYWTNFLYKNKLWKTKVGKTAITGEEAKVFNELHKEKETGTPRMGGVVIWMSVLITALIFWILGQLIENGAFVKFDFISRNQTWLPLAALLIGAIVGLIDDALEIIRSKKENAKGGLSLSKRLLVVIAIGVFVGYWFSYKLGIDTVTLPIFGEIYAGPWIMLLTILVMLVIYAGGIIDGLDGLAGGVFAIIFSSYGIIAFFQSQIDLAALCAAITGGLLAFLWFNIPPARFYMTETGSMALTLGLVVVAFMTDSLGGGRGVSVLPLIAFPLVITALSSLVQVFWKKTFKRKLFKIAPLHHHFEALGWPSYKVVMRYWVFGIVCAMFGVIVALGF